MRSATFDPDTIRSRLRELAFLNSRATIFFRAVDGKPDKAALGNGSSNGSNGSNGATQQAADAAAVAGSASVAAAEAAAAGWEVFHYSGGLSEYVRYLNRDKEPIHEPFVFSKQARGRAWWSGGGGGGGGGAGRHGEADGFAAGAHAAAAAAAQPCDLCRTLPPALLPPGRRVHG